jgi:hypothetical protein
MNVLNNGKIAEKSGVATVTNKNTGEFLELRAASGGTDDNSVMTRKDVLELLATVAPKAGKAKT